MSEVKRKNIVVLISGSGTNLQAIIDACKEGKIDGDISLVISNKEDAYGLVRAEQSDISTAVINHKAFESREDYDAALQTILDQFEPDVIVMAGFMRILTADFVNQNLGKMVNIHPSLLPKYQGLNTHQRAIDAGDKEHGVSVHYVTPELDGGPVILQAKVPVFEGDTAEDLQQRVHQQEHAIYPLVVQWFCQDRLNFSDNLAYLDGNALPIGGYAQDDEDIIQ